MRWGPTPYRSRRSNSSGDAAVRSRSGRISTQDSAPSAAIFHTRTLVTSADARVERGTQQVVPYRGSNSGAAFSTADLEYASNGRRTMRYSPKPLIAHDLLRTSCRGCCRGERMPSKGSSPSPTRVGRDLERCSTESSPSPVRSEARLYPQKLSSRRCEIRRVPTRSGLRLRNTPRFEETDCRPVNPLRLHDRVGVKPCSRATSLTDPHLDKNRLASVITTNESRLCPACKHRSRPQANLSRQLPSLRAATAQRVIRFYKVRRKGFQCH